jgi:hypothetical protein
MKHYVLDKDGQKVCVGHWQLNGTSVGSAHDGTRFSNEITGQPGICGNPVTRNGLCHRCAAVATAESGSKK